MGKDQTQTTTQTQGLDPASQQFVDQSRQQAGSAADFALNAPGNFFLGADPRSVSDIIKPFQDPFQKDVIDATRAEFDVLRERAVGGAGGTNQQAQLAGALGGSRQGVAEGLRLSELDRAQTSQISGLLSNNFQQAVSNAIPFADRQRGLQQQQAQEGLFRRGAAQNFRNLGLGPTGSQGEQTQVQSGNLFRDLAGAGQIAAGLFAPGGAPGGIPGVPPGAPPGGGQFDPSGLPTGLKPLNFPPVGG